MLKEPSRAEGKPSKPPQRVVPTEEFFLRADAKEGEKRVMKIIQMTDNRLKWWDKPCFHNGKLVECIQVASLVLPLNSYSQ